MRNLLLAVKNFFSGSCAVTTVLCLLSPVIFFWEKNWHVYTNQSLLISLALLLTGCLLWLALTHLARKLLVRWASVLSPNTWRLLTDIIMLGAGALLLSFLLARIWIPLAQVWSPQAFSFKFWLLLALILALVFSLLRIFSLVRVLNTLLLIWLLLNGVMMGQGMFFEKDEVQLASQPKIVLKHKPNIYLFIWESAHSLEMQEEVYGLELTAFRDFLRGHEFIYYPKVYSNSGWTLNSMVDIFTLQDVREIERGLMDVNRAARRLLGGDAQNFVFRTLKENGYFVQAFYPATHYMHSQGPYLDQVYPPQQPTIAASLAPFIDVNPQVYNYLWAKNIITPDISGGSIENYMDGILAKLENHQPLFTLIKFYGTHSQLDHTWEKAQEFVQSKFYQKAFQSSLDRLLPILSQIIAKDPQSLIVLMGDHGARRFRRLWDGRSVPSQNQWDEMMDKAGVDKKTIVDDYLSTFLAIRTPPPRTDISYGYQLNHRNLFWHIFANLSEDRELLKLRTPIQPFVEDIIKEAQPSQ